MIGPLGQRGRFVLPRFFLAIRGYNGILLLLPMFYAEKLEWTKSAAENTYSINSEGRRELESIMSRIYNEDPSYWPDGLDIKGHNEIYMIRQASTNRAVGFTGWQEFPDTNGKKVGLYTIGILPEYRRNGYAKEAVSKLISKKASEVDYVRAYIAPHNTPSLELAKDLNVEVVKSAMSIGKTLGGMAGGAAANTAFWDWYNRPPGEASNPFKGKYYEGMDKQRIGMGILNGMLGAGGGYAASKGMHMLRDPQHAVAGAAMLAVAPEPFVLSPVKDWITQSLPAAHGLPKMVEALSNTHESAGIDPKDRMALYGAGGLGLLAALYGGSKWLGHMKHMQNLEEQKARGTIKVTLPTRDPNDRETEIQIPMQELSIANYQREKLQRDLRRRVYKETKERTAQRAPAKKKPPQESNPQKPVEANAPEESEGSWLGGLLGGDGESPSPVTMPAKEASIGRVKYLLDTIYG
jgi:ribosomal protein S18 acetylase RimI-like enzyme